MAGMGFVGAGGAAGTYEGLRDWMQGRRQKVVQGQRDEDRLREQALQNQALATEAADREYDIARQRILDDQNTTLYQNKLTEFGRDTETYNREGAERTKIMAAREKLKQGIRDLDDPRATPFRKELAMYDIDVKGRPSEEFEELLKEREKKLQFAPSGQLLDVNDPKNLGGNYAAPVRAPQSADDIVKVETVDEKGNPVTRYMRESAAAAHGTFQQAPAKGAKPPTIPAKQQEGLIGADSSEALLNQMADLYQAGAKDKVGPVSGRYTEAMQMIGADKDENWAKFVAASSTIESDIIRAVTGAAVGKQEEVRIVRQIPRPWDPPVQWQAKYQQSIDNMRQLRTGIHQQIERAATHAAGGDISPGVMLDVTRPAAGAKPKFTIIDSK